jgi:CRISPR-associated protein Cmr4
MGRMTRIKSWIVGLLAETALHPGIGQSSDVVDLPVSRDAVSGLPQVPETGLKGAMREWARLQPGWEPETDGDGKRKDCSEINQLFGDAESGAGAFFVTTARLALLPIRRLGGSYAWVTTPGILERLGRDRAMAGDATSKKECIDATNEATKALKDASEAATKANCIGPVLASAAWSEDLHFLEEYPFHRKVDADARDAVIKCLEPLLGSSPAACRLDKQLVVMGDDDFEWFARNALPVAARNALDESKTSQSLWYEETVPPDAVFWFLLQPRSSVSAGSCEELMKTFSNATYLRVGGNETVGQGWTHVTAMALGGS